MPASLKELEGKTVVLGDAGWSLITNPLLAQFDVDFSTINYVAAGVTAWGQTLAQGQGDAALSWEGLRAQWDAAGLDFEYWIGKEHSRFPANTFVIRRSDFEDPALADIYTRYLRGWAMGLEFGHHNPRAATQITMQAPELSDALEQAFPDLNVAVESMWQQALIFRGNWATRQGWGWHDMESWRLYFDTTREIGQITSAITPEDVLKNDYIAGVNDFDKEQVRADAMGYQLTPEFEAVAVPEGAGAEATPMATPGA
jgi:NitT/TauT family transport system substrate-binding protein